MTAKLTKQAFRDVFDMAANPDRATSDEDRTISAEYEEVEEVEDEEVNSSFPAVQYELEPYDYDGTDLEIDEDIAAIKQKAQAYLDAIDEEIEKNTVLDIPLVQAAHAQLTLQLNTIKLRARIKQTKDTNKIRATKRVAPQTVNNTLVMTREEALRLIEKDEDE